MPQKFAAFVFTFCDQPGEDEGIIVGKRHIER